MKSTNYLKDLRTKSETELAGDLTAAKKELFNLRFQNATNQLDNTARIKEVKRNIARIQTIITEKAAGRLERRLAWKVRKEI
ncbi:MAG: 50S ribosomal protein L29 [Lachnospiraceae bacterium]|nr:50S ribosomal protein L29 [Lachnospiraceae bacterium]